MVVYDDLIRFVLRNFIRKKVLIQKMPGYLGRAKTKATRRLVKKKARKKLSEILDKMSSEENSQPESSESFIEPVHNNPEYSPDQSDIDPISDYEGDNEPSYKLPENAPSGPDFQNDPIPDYEPDNVPSYDLPEKAPSVPDFQIVKPADYHPLEMPVNTCEIETCPCQYPLETDPHPLESRVNLILSQDFNPEQHPPPIRDAKDKESLLNYAGSAYTQAEIAQDFQDFIILENGVVLYPNPN